VTLWDGLLTLWDGLPRPRLGSPSHNIRSPSRKLVVALALLAFAGSAGAHNRGTSYSGWTLDAQGGEVRARVSQLELTRLQLLPTQADYAARVGALLAGELQLWAGAGRCAAGPVTATPTEDGWVAARWRVDCAGGGALTIRSTLLHTVAPSHLHFARVELGGGAPLERVLTHAEAGFALGEPPDPAATLGRYVRLGVDHILSGWDHLAFVLALILLAGSLREVALVATGFTLAHSFTLAAAVLGWATVRGGAVEALIGFSIALVAAENLWLRSGRERWLPLLSVALLAGLAVAGATRLPAVLLAGLALFTACYFALARHAARPARLRVAVAFVFGLVHGFGFAGALTELRLPDERVVVALLGFNGGVELGQLLVIALAWPLLQLLERRPRVRLWAGDAASACICALGTFWFVTRLYG
jgi:hypothetical protein